jgi:hypothetical protein
MNEKQKNKLLKLVNKMADDLLEDEKKDVRDKIKKDVVDKVIKMFYEKVEDDI